MVADDAQGATEKEGPKKMRSMKYFVPTPTTKSPYDGVLEVTHFAVNARKGGLASLAVEVQKAGRRGRGRCQAELGW